MVNLPLYNLEGNEVASVSASDEIFASTKSAAAVKQALLWHMAKKRSGNASTLTRAEVRGGGKKPWSQKGTGRARAGTSRSPLWRGGGVIFGPKPRDYSFKLSKKARKAALAAVLSDRVQGKAIRVVEELKVPSGKTKEAQKTLKPFMKEGQTLLIVVAGEDDLLSRALGNLKGVQLVKSGEVNIYDLLNNKSLLLTKDAVKLLEERIGK